jgi:hypothetical protein
MDTTQSIIEKNIDSYLNKQSIIDNRESKYSNKSIIDYKTNQLREKLKDESLDEGMVALALKKLGEGEVDKILSYVLRKSHTPGRAFVKICHNAMKAKDDA